MPSVIFFALLLLLLWLLLIQPQRRRKQRQTQLLTQLAPGQEVITTGGLYGTIHEVADDHVLLEIAPETRVRVAKSAVAGRIEPEPSPAEPPETSLP
ncbi:MAG: preprotein translocase subunit YajC [Actinomycetota bacterium]|nr:preprotein translocase subunit YajC [Actinomycetota bacterium]